MTDSDQGKYTRPPLFLLARSIADLLHVVGQPVSHWFSDDFYAGLLESSDATTTDTILGNLVASVVDDNDPDATAVEIVRLNRYPELTASICVYREVGDLWLQFRVGYVGSPAQEGAPKKDFTQFVRDRKHNPFTTFDRNIDFENFFVNDVDDERHRFGTDIVLADIGINAAADLLDYLLVRCDY